MTTGERIRALRLKKGMTQEELGNKIGVKFAAINKYENGLVVNLKRSIIQKLADTLDTTPMYLMGWEDSATTPITTQSKKGIRINVYGSVPAGVPIEAIQDIIDWEEIPAEWAEGGQEYIALKIKGDSMYPKYLEGDIVIIRLQPDCESGQDCVAYVNGYDATLKKVVKKQDCIILQPLNSIYDPKIYDYNDENSKVDILGVVVQIRRNV